MDQEERAELIGRCSVCGEVGDGFFYESVDPAPDNGPFRGGWWGRFHGACSHCKTYWLIQIGRCSYTEDRPIEFRGYQPIDGRP